MEPLSRSAQRTQIQAELDRYFGCHVEVAPRAMAALQGRYSQHGHGILEPYVPSISVFEALLLTSPACLSLLVRAGVPTESIFSGREDDGAAPIDEDTLDFIFRGNGLYRKRRLRLCSAGSQVRKTRALNEADLFHAFLETAYRGPFKFREYVDANVLGKYASEVGDLLLDCGFVDPEQVDDGWDGCFGSYEGPYVARSPAARKLIQLAKEVRSIEITDPSHGDFQFAIWMDGAGLVRVRPFGASATGFMSPEIVAPDQQFVFRQGVFQPLSSVMPGFDNSVIAELEDMINCQRCSEGDFQRFFERFPEFLAGLDYRCVHPQLALTNVDGPDYIPDFMLEPMASEFCDILELKLPYSQLTTRLRNQSRSRFRALITEAVGQLTEYRRYFDTRDNRLAFHSRYGLQAYYPRMILVVGRRHDFKSDVERQELRSVLPKDLDVWTYDDLIGRAKKYQDCLAATQKS